MLKVESGPYLPVLEQALIEAVAKRRDDPFSPVFLVAPSGRLLDRLQDRLAEEVGALLSLQFHTFESLADLIVDETGGATKTVLSDRGFWDALVKEIVREDRPFPGLADLAVPDGFPPQIRGTIRDLIDAGVPADMELLTDAVREDFLGRDIDVGWLLQLFHFYRRYRQRADALSRFCPRSQRLEQAVRSVKDVPSLAAAGEIIFYGFYDLTGLQRDLFEAVAKRYPSRFFFPYVPGHPAYSFADRFRKNVLSGLTEDDTSGGRGADAAGLASPAYAVVAERIRLASLSGLQDEAWYVAQEVQRLHRDDGVPYERMAVIARHQERLRQSLLDVFSDHGIPFQTTAKEPFGERPLVHDSLQFLKTADPVVGATLRRDFASNPDLALALDAIASLPESASWSAFVEAALAALDPVVRSEADPETWSRMRAEIGALARYDLLAPPGRVRHPSRREFTDALADRWMQIAVSPPGQSPAGVRLLHAEAARGWAFDAVFAIGIEERVFPRVVREDPFLRDDARFQLFNTLGYKISDKMAGLDEEKLLFHLIVTSAKRFLYVTYQRSDESGSVVGPSSFFRAFAADNGLDAERDVDSVPRLYREKLSRADPRLLAGRDVMVRYVSTGRDGDAGAYLRAAGEDAARFETGLRFVDALHRFGNPGGQDGCVGPQDPDAIFGERGVSATALETFGRCPFQFFAQRLLGVAAPDDDIPGLRVPPDRRGLAVHDFFERFYRGLDVEKAGADFPVERFERTFAESIAVFSAGEVGVHSVIWEAEKAVLKAALSSFIREDWARFQGDPHRPAFFEVEIPGELDPPLDGIRFFGKPDRIDVAGDSVRIVDYKTGRVPKPLRDVLRGRRSQPPLYLLLAERFFAARGDGPRRMSFVYRPIGGDRMDEALTDVEWRENRSSIIHTLKTQLDLIRAGEFVILPDKSAERGYCRVCSVQTICRKSHGPSRSRSENGPGATLQSLRAKKAPREGKR